MLKLNSLPDWESHVFYIRVTSVVFLSFISLSFIPLSCWSFLWHRCFKISAIKSRSVACPFLIDPSSRATEWLRTHLKQHRLEVINQQDPNFITSLELAVRFGKTLIIQEMDGVEPVLYPLLRRDLITQGPRYVVQIGDKVIDYNEEFRLFLATRNPSPFIPPDAASVITEVNFTTTRAGLRGQLLALTIQQEKPELETQKTRLLQQEEDKKIQLATLEESLLEVHTHTHTHTYIHCSKK
ncbi:unnamed protein product [Oncorhynchus mykiss]|uniref:Dynein heavy chain ATP-binding dynein motor region domain-containing protein n=1 Tax=Oncorhynchus mykiss TaxID=8022 RepID=A0A060YYB7_ONCMY|nr:unnamed protein product [Oncorhynchus mykiss]